MSVIFATNSAIHYKSMSQSTSTIYKRSQVTQAYRVFDNSTHAITMLPANIDNETELWFQFQWYKSGGGNSTDDGYMARVFDSNGRECFRLDVSNGYLFLSVYGNATYNTASAFLGAGMNSIKIRYRNDGPGLTLQADLYMNGILAGTTAGTNNTRLMPRNWSFEMVDASSTTDYMSEFICSTVDLETYGLSKYDIIAAGTDNDFTGLVTNVSDDIGTSGMVGASPGDKQSFIPPTINTAKLIHSYAPNALVWCGNTQRTVRFYLKIGGVQYNGPNHVLTINKQNLLQENFLLDPSDNQPWTSAKINAAEVGIEIVS
ncbi:hypothetical protein [Roseovarius Plymouth podovirus 1]|uniref:Uncharacterized protein n=2 Tax=Roseovarius Plymouth podovirus 1 TaxID=926474 RepID=K4Q4U5_9CAUD|nr:hypothetical protein HYO70_gp34 [Roseovarius Plymouth podovirus 1]CBW47027.1 hypothetical protein [Roseovarius sp. 217 phage 1]CBX87964.1 hypothetical protein [Roseovarius Plymouth podovirus 1]